MRRIWPAGPPMLMKPSLNHKPRAVRNGTAAGGVVAASMVGVALSGMGMSGTESQRCAIVHDGCAPAPPPAAAGEPDQRRNEHANERGWHLRLGHHYFNSGPWVAAWETCGAAEIILRKKKRSKFVLR